MYIGITLQLPILLPLVQNRNSLYNIEIYSQQYRVYKNIFLYNTKPLTLISVLRNGFSRRIFRTQAIMFGIRHIRYPHVKNIISRVSSVYSTIPTEYRSYRNFNTSLRAESHRTVLTISQNSNPPNSTMEDRIENLKNLVKSYPDFPSAGILFRDIFPILQDPKAFSELKSVMGEYVKTKIPAFDVIIGLESRGFIFGSVLASELKLPFVPIRKPGKLPGEIASAQFVLEYGTDTFEIQKDAIKEGQKILLVDDLLATGGSLQAASTLVEKVGGEVVGSFVIMELVDLLGREKLKSPTYSLIRF